MSAAEFTQALMADEVALRRLRELRGWTPKALEMLNIGIDQGRVVIPVHNADGETVNLLRYQPNPERRDGRPKMLATPGQPRDLFPSPEGHGPGHDDGPLWIVEGEADAIAAWSAGLHAIGVPGSQGWRSEWAPRFAGRDVIVCCDCDRPGRELAARVADDLLEHAAAVRVLDLSPARDDGYDLSDLVIDGRGDLDAVAATLHQAADSAPPHLPEEQRPPRPRLSVADWRTAILEHLEGTASTPAWPIPFRDLMDATDGGIRPGEIWVIAGWTSAGKSIFTDAIADTASASGASVHLYLTEMTVVQRGLRMVARKTGLPMRGLRRADLTGTQLDRARKALGELRYSASVVTDWTPEQVAADIRATKTNVAIVDLLHGFDYQDERELSGIVSRFAQAATTDAGGAGSAIVLVCQLNDGQMRDARSARRPKPGMHSLKGSSWIKQRADVVCFVWRKDDEDGMPTDEGEIWIAKNRNGATATVPVRLVPSLMVFEERTPAGQAGDDIPWGESA